MMKHWAALVLIAACGKGSKSDDQPVGVAHLRHEEPAKGSAVVLPPATYDEACAAKLKDFTPWLTALELERSSYEIDFMYKLQKIDRAPLPVPQKIDAVEITASHIEAFDATEANHADSKLGEKPTQKALEDRLKAIHDMADETPDRLRADIDEKATWNNVARVMDAAAKAGYKQVVFAFTATSRLAIPPGDNEWTMTREDVDAASKELEEMQKKCPAWDRAIFRHVPNPDEVVDAKNWATEITEAFEKCNCAVSVDDAKVQLFKEARWLQAVPRVGVVVQLADTGATVTSPGKALWSDAHKALLAAAADGAPPPTVKLVAK